jgi:hypothetical protein
MCCCTRSTVGLLAALVMRSGAHVLLHPQHCWLLAALMFRSAARVLLLHSQYCWLLTALLLHPQHY